MIMLANLIIVFFFFQIILAGYKFHERGLGFAEPYLFYYKKAPKG